MNQPVALYRENGLTDEEFKRLDVAVKRQFSIRPLMVRKVSLVKDVYGDMVESVEYVEGGIEVVAHGDIDQRVVDSMLRLTSPRPIGRALDRLAAHKRFTGSVSQWKIINDDICVFLKDQSEYAIRETVERFILDTGSPFFPETAKFVDAVKSLDASMRRALNKAPALPPQEKMSFIPDPPKYRRRFIQLIKLLPMRDKTKWQTRWCDAFQKVVEEKRASEKK